jgi:hypothetical protein
MKNETRKSTLDELSHAVGEYNHARGKWQEATRMVEAKRKEMESFMRDEAKTKAEMDRFAATLYRIANDLEKMP